MGAVCSTIGSAAEAIVTAVYTIIMTLISLAVTLVVAVFDIIYDILCCKCFGQRAETKRTGTHIYKWGPGQKKKVETTNEKADVATTEPPEAPAKA